MRRIIFTTIMAFILLAATICQAGEIYTEFSTQTESAIITRGAGILGGIIVKGDGTNAVTITVYNGTSTGGQKMTPTMVLSGDVRSASLDVQYSSGVYVAASSSGAFEYTVYYKGQ